MFRKQKKNWQNGFIKEVLILVMKNRKHFKEHSTKNGSTLDKKNDFLPQ
jgi:hypothetical protein